MAIKCPSCQQWFDDMKSYQNHSCSSGTLGGASDLRKAKNESGSTEGGTGER
ncbi:MAG: hypothetical protein ACREAD_04205 [Nitrosopumilaceae archaeon]